MKRKYLVALLASLALLATSGLEAAPGAWIPKPTTTSQPATAQAKPLIQFNAMPWGSTREQVKLAMAGYQPTDYITKYGDFRYTGNLLGERCSIYCLFDPAGGLVKVFITLYPDDVHYRECYNDTQNSLTIRYGRPEGSIEQYRAPYKKGDGHEDAAIRLGKADIGTLWKDRLGTSVGEEITTDLTVRIVYEPAAWSDESDRRIKAEAQQL